MKRMLACVFLLFLAAASGPAQTRTSVVDTDGLPVADPALDLGRAELLRTDDGRMVLSVRFAGAPSCDRLRVMLDVAPGRGEPGTGADFMLEGGRFYRYPEGAQGWTWDEMMPPLAATDGQTATFILPELPGAEAGTWYAETTKPDWSAVDRLPNAGAFEFAMADLPLFATRIRVGSENLSELLDHSRKSLSFLLDARLKAARWEESGDGRELAAPSWKVPFRPNPLPVLLTLVDAATGERAAAMPERSFSCSNALRWTGTTLGIGWQLVAEPEGETDLRLTGLLQAASDRCVRVSVGCGGLPRGWEWQDDTSPSPFGLDGRQSLYPLSVLSFPDGAVVAETDIAEPRVFRFAAELDPSFFGIIYDLALTPLTSNFPGRTSFRCALRALPGPAATAFRRALAGFYARNPSFAASCVPGAAPFGLIDPARTDPWSACILMPPRVPRTPAEALRVLNLEAAGLDRFAEWAAAALLSAARGRNGAMQMSFADDRQCAGARVLLNADPDTRTTTNLPLSAAMAAWREVKRGLERGAEGTLLGSMAGGEVPDYNPAAIGVADYPCTFEKDVLKPCLANSSAEYELTVALAGALGTRGKYVAGIGAFAGSPFLAGAVDASVELVERTGAGEYEPLDPGEVLHRRAMAGTKACSMVFDGGPGDQEYESARSWCEDCVFWGFLPVMPGPGGREASSAFFPLALRVARAGWRPVADVGCDEPSLRLEQFGSPTSGVFHITLRNSSKAPIRAPLRLPAGAGLIVFAPLAASVGPVVALPPGGFALLDVIRPDGLADELKFLDRWGVAEAEPAHKTLESVAAERAMGVVCSASYPVPAVRGEANAVVVEVENGGNRPVSLSGLKIISPTQFRPADLPAVVVEPGSRGRLDGFFMEEDATNSPWLEVQWSLKAGDEELTCTRMIRPSFVDPVRVQAQHGDIVAGQLDATITMDLRNFSTNRQAVRVAWEGDFRGGSRKEVLQPLGERSVALPVTARKPLKGQMNVRVLMGDEKVFGKWYDVDFRSAEGGRIGSDRRNKEEQP